MKKIGLLLLAVGTLLLFFHYNPILGPGDPGLVRYSAGNTFACKNLVTFTSILRTLEQDAKAGYERAKLGAIAGQCTGIVSGDPYWVFDSSPLKSYAGQRIIRVWLAESGYWVLERPLIQKLTSGEPR